MENRNKNFIKQIKSSVVFRVLALIISFVLVRYMLEYLGIEKFGLWSVILSIMSWILYFDFGISNGVKNKVSQSLAKNKNLDAQEYISTGYVILTLFSIIVYLSLFFIASLIDWQHIFNIYSITNDTLILILRIVVFFILLNFILSIITAVFLATQKASLVVVNQFLTNFFLLLMIYLLIKFTKTNLVYLAFFYGVVNTSVTLVLSMWFYKKNNYLSPSLKLVKKDKIRDVSVIGMKFFWLQLTILFMLTTDRIIITQLLGPSYVTNYDILYKYFGAIMIMHSIINSPLWSMYTEAYTKNDFKWISAILIKMVKLFIIYILILAVMVTMANFIISIWLNNDEIELSTSNYIYMSVMFLVLMWHSVFAYFSNGIEKTNIQLITTMIGTIINIPLSILFVNYFDMGLNGVLLATILSLSIFGIFGPIQAVKEIKNMKSRLINNEYNTLV